MSETVFDELKRYIGFGPEDEAALRELHPVLAPHFERIAYVFYQRILEHDQARTALVGGESQVGRLKVTLVQWMDKLLSGPWDDAYYELRCRIGRVHVRINLPQHYMFGAMNVLRLEMDAVLESHFAGREHDLARARRALEKIIDLELAVMLHTYREDLAEQQRRTERLSTFGQLVGSIGHELRNPLGVIETSLFILKNRLPEDQRVHKHIGRIEEQVTVANQIITNLLDLIRDRPLNALPVGLNGVLAASVEAVGRPPGVSVEVEGVSGLPQVKGDAIQLRQVFVNLVENAVHAASPEGRVRVVGEVEDGQVCVSVEDTGLGVSEEIRRRLFEPLITSKEKGIGLGLALVKRIVERHRGTIRYEPRGNTGARFVVRLPVA